MSVYVSIPVHESEITMCDSGKIESMSGACGHHKCNAGTCARMTQEESHHKCSVLHLQKDGQLALVVAECSLSIMEGLLIIFLGHGSKKNNCTATG